MSRDITAFRQFTTTVGRRLKAGAEEYGDQSFSASPIRLIQEIREELADVAGWAFVMDCRLDAIEQRLAQEEWAQEEGEE